MPAGRFYQMLDRARSPQEQAADVSAATAPHVDRSQGAVEIAAEAARELIQSAAYAAIVEPIRGGAQIIERTMGGLAPNGAESAVVKIFGSIGIEQPADKGFGSIAWHMQQLGGSVGMMLPFGLMLGRARALSGAAAIGAAETAMAGTGYGLLRPVGDTQENFAWQKMKQGLGDGAIMGTVGLASPYMRRYTALGTQALEQSALPSIVKNPIVAGLRTDLLQTHLLPGIGTAVPAGFVAAQVEGWKAGRVLTLDHTVGEQMYGMAFIGSSMALAHRVARAGQGDSAANRIAANDNPGTALAGQWPDLRVGDGMPKHGSPRISGRVSVGDFQVRGHNDNALRDTVEPKGRAPRETATAAEKRSASDAYLNLAGAFADPGLQRRLLTGLVSEYRGGEVPASEAHKQEIHRILADNGFYVDGASAGKLVIVAPKLRLKDATDRALAPQQTDFYERSGLMFQLDSRIGEPDPAYRVTPVRLTRSDTAGLRTVPIDLTQDALLTRGSDGKLLLTGTSFDHERLIERIEDTVRLQLAFTDPAGIQWARRQRSGMRDGRLGVVAEPDSTQQSHEPDAAGASGRRSFRPSEVIGAEDPLAVERRTEAFKSELDRLYLSGRGAAAEAALTAEMTMHGLEFLMDAPGAGKAQVQRYIQQQMEQSRRTNPRQNVSDSVGYDNAIAESARAAVETAQRIMGSLRL